MAYIVVAYPKLSEKSFEWIQSYRKKNDPRYFSVIKPHFTIVFAVNDLSEEKFIHEVKKQANGIKKIDFEIKVATINQDDSGNYYHEFLVPDKGYSDFVKLHDKLYSQAFSKYLRFDIDYIPHIGIGNSDDVLTSKKLVDELNTEGVNISGVVDSLDIIEYKEGVVKTLETISFE